MSSSIVLASQGDKAVVIRGQCNEFYTIAIALESLV